MKANKNIAVLFLFCVFLTSSIVAKTFEVSTQKEFEKAQSSAVKNDIISWLPGIYKDIYLNLNKNNITIQAKVLGETIFTGASRALIRGSGVTFKGFQYIGGNIGSSDVIKLEGNHITVAEVNIVRYRSFKYLVMKRGCQYNTVYKCNFENRLNLVDQNILYIMVSPKNPGFHKVQYCSFRNIDGTGRDMGVEPIRIGASHKAQFDSKSIVEYCYFNRCNGDGELISNKSGHNILRYNTFEDNPLAELVLRHGSYSYVYGNFFLKGKGGIRIKEGRNHYIYNNYFSEQTERSIIMQSGKIDPVKNVYIMHNTFVNTARLRLGGDKEVVPKKVVMVNNLFANSKKRYISEVTGKESYTGNMYEGILGIPEKKGLKKVTPLLIENEFGLYEFEGNSPAINSAQKNKIKLPLIQGLDADNKLSLDIVKNKRPGMYNQKDVGCFEFNASGANVLKPIATSENTGPSYDTTTVLELEAEKERKVAADAKAKEKEYGVIEYDKATKDTKAKEKEFEEVEYEKE